MYWLEVAVACDGEGAEAVAEVLRPLAYGDGVVLEQRSDADALEEDALEPQITVKIFLPGEQDTPVVRQRIREALYHMGRLYPIADPTFRELEEKDWAHAWKEHYRAFRVGARIWIQPSWLPLAESLKADDVVLRLDPGMAFGTGLHPTTQMCLRALQEFVHEGDRVLDVGTGSGILAIAAAKLGATEVLGVDTDSQAVRTARQNAAQNGVEDQIKIESGSLARIDDREWDLVTVNILAPVIIKMLGQDDLLDYVANDGHLVFSGIIDRQEAEVRQALVDAGGVVVDTLTVRDWITLIARRQ